MSNSSRRAFLGGVASLAAGTAIGSETSIKGDTINVTLMSGLGGGFSKKIQVPFGTRIDELVKKEVKKRSLSGILIKVNRDNVDEDYVLEEGDRISVTPKNIEGA